MRFVVLNGPPSSGKTTASKYLITLLMNKGFRVMQDSFAAPMKHYVATLLGEKYDKIKKDIPHPELLGSTPRSLLIDLSEDFMKVKYGVDIFGRMLYRRALRFAPSPDFVVVDDSGFIPEFEALGEADKRHIVRITRPGTTYDNDSRSYLDEYDFILTNDGSLEDLLGATAALATQLNLIMLGELEVRE